MRLSRTVAHQQPAQGCLVKAWEIDGGIVLEPMQIDDIGYLRNDYIDAAIFLTQLLEVG